MALCHAVCCCLLVRVGGRSERVAVAQQDDTYVEVCFFTWNWTSQQVSPKIHHFQILLKSGEVHHVAIYLPCVLSASIQRNVQRLQKCARSQRSTAVFYR